VLQGLLYGLVLNKMNGGENEQKTSSTSIYSFVAVLLGVVLNGGEND
jgi:hypothetical protein